MKRTSKAPLLWKIGKPSSRENLIMTPLYKHPPGGGGGTSLFGLYGDVPLDRVWFVGLVFLNRVYNLTWLCPKEGQNLS